MKAFFIKLSEFVKDDTGALSSMRLLFLAWGFVALVVWCVICFKTNTIVALPWSLTSFIVSLVGGKVLQSWTESIGSSTTPSIVSTSTIATPVVTSPIQTPITTTITTTTVNPSVDQTPPVENSAVMP